MTLRADARRNREQIIAAARTVFAERGYDVPMDEIARAARVGVGTLYRRFPDRDALIRAVATDSLTRILDEARTAEAEESSAWPALVRLLTRSAELQFSPVAVQGADPAIAGLRDDLLERLGRLVLAAQQEGRLRADVGVGDVAQLSALILRPLSARDPEIARMSASRCTAILIDGLQARPGAALPGRPLQRQDLSH
ncbi:helix-turn-helix domain-containing protein [Actinoplanes sp. NPDC026619]|uniref:TetR/AcrR family transcriptional regulator n=1 Tax=Actinoplanes sp. NPDC026619 TaxID=3155798 RepID=UPI0033FB3419